MNVTVGSWQFQVAPEGKPFLGLQSHEQLKPAETVETSVRCAKGRRHSLKSNRLLSVMLTQTLWTNSRCATARATCREPPAFHP
eukprot:7906784-Pyramimonas_sp.AAC.1